MFNGNILKLSMRKHKVILGSLSNPQLESILNKRLPLNFTRALFKFCKWASKRVPINLIHLAPPIFSNILGQWALEAGASDAKLKAWFRQAQKSSFSSKLGFAYESNLYIHSLKIDDYIEFINHSIDTIDYPGENIENIRSYSMWNLNFKTNNVILSKIKEKLEDQDRNDKKEYIERYLPEFTSNMGHIGFLYFYISFYNKIENPRKIHIWQDIAPNKYFLKKILDTANFDVIQEPGIPPRYTHNLLEVDNLLYSRISKGNWRFEVNSAAYSKQFFPEFITGNRKLVTLADIELEKSYEKLKSIGLDSNRWIVALHIREPKSGYISELSQARDSDILSYRKFCEVIRDLGGQVVRMGDERFPQLPRNFPAIDYAYSNVRSAEIDVWLWAKSKWWTGNPSGALWPPIAFDVPRMITNQWFWDPTGPEQDLYVPKLLYSSKEKRILNVSETIEHPLSRCMNANLLRQEELILIDNSPEDLLKAAVDIYTRISNLRFQPKNDLSKILGAEFQIDSNSNTMSVPDSFSAKYFDLLKSN